MTKKRILAIGDLHCGHSLAITPPQYWREDLKDIQGHFWRWYTEGLELYKPLDICICNGDAVDGPGKKENYGHLTTNIGKQIDMAEEVLRTAGASKYFFTLGTPYHVENNMEAEEILADRFDAPCKAKLKLDINGKIIMAKHVSSKTSIPHGQGLVLKRMLWSHIKHTTEGHVKPDLVMRSHVHEYVCIQNRLGISMTLPCMCIGNQEHGRKYDGWYDIGFCIVDIYEDGNITTDVRIYNPIVGDEVIHA